MNRFLSLVLVLFLALAVSADNTAPVIGTVVEKSGGELLEGTSIEFEVSATDAESDPVTFIWHFGDGSEAIETIEPFAVHNYYFDIEGSSLTKEFTVTVYASDGDLSTAESVEIEVKKTNLKVRLIEPPSMMLEKGNDVVIKAEVLNRDNYSQVATSVDVSVEFNGKEISLAKENKYFEGSIPGEFYYNNIMFLDISAKRGRTVANTKRIPLYFKPAEISVASSPFGKTGVLAGTAFGRLEFDLRFSAEARPLTGEFKAVLLANGTVLEEHVLQRNESVYVADFEHVLTVEDLLKEPVLEVSGGDEHGNFLKKTVFAVVPETDNPKFQITILKPLGAERGNVGIGNEIEIIATVESGTEDVKMSIFSPGIGLTEMYSNANEFVGSTIIGLDLNGRARIVVYAEGLVDEKFVSDLEVIELIPSAQFLVEFVYPVEGQTGMDGDGKQIIISVKTADGKGLNQNDFIAKLSIDGKPEDKIFNLDKETGNFVATLEEPLEGQHNVRVDIPQMGGMAGNARIKTDIARGIDFIGIGLILVILGGLGFLAVYMKNKLKMPQVDFRAQIEKMRPSQLKPKPVSTRSYFKEEMRKLEKDFYKRKITEDEFREKMLDLRTAARKTEAKVAAPRIHPKAQAGVSELRLPPKKTEIKESEEERLQQAIEKKRAPGGLAPLILDRPKPIESKPFERKPVSNQKPATQEMFITQKPRETISKNKLDSVRSGLDYVTQTSKPSQATLSPDERDAVEKLIPALKDKASAFTRDEIFKSIIEEGFSAKVAREVVKRLFN